MRTINDVRYTMWATVIPRFDPTTSNTPVAGQGKYVRTQDPDSMEIITKWVPTSQDNPGTDVQSYTVKCYARGYTALGFRSSANRETYLKGDYTEIESIQFDFPTSVLLSHQALVTNIRTHEEDTGSDYLWVDGDTGKPIVWEVQGVTPVIDPFGRPLRNTTVLKRAEVQ